MKTASNRLLTSTARSATIMRVLAKAIVSYESAEYERSIALKEHEHKKRETEIKRSRNKEKNLVILAMEKKVAQNFKQSNKLFSVLTGIIQAINLDQSLARVLIQACN